MVGEGKRGEEQEQPGLALAETGDWELRELAMLVQVSLINGCWVNWRWK